MSGISRLSYDSLDLTEVANDLEKQESQAWPESEKPSISGRDRPTAYLDGLRGLAAFFVYMSHHVPWFYGFDNSENSLERGYGDGGKDFAMLPFVRIFFTGGSAAVAIFFVLSGYVLSRGPLSLLRGGQASIFYHSLMSAIIRRPFRLFLPAAGVSLAFAFIMQLPFGLAPHMTWPEAKENIFAQLLNWADEFWRIVDPFESHGIAERWFPYDPPLWTISIEFRGSMVVFALVAWYSRVNPRTRLLLFTVIGLVFLFLYEWSMACFMAGVALAINDLEGFDSSIFKRYSGRLRSFSHLSVFMLGWWLLCQPAGKKEPERSMKAPGWYYMTQLIPSNYYKQEYWRFWQSWGSVMLVYGVLNLRLVQRFFNTKYLRYLGKVSFSLYLTHIPFLWTIGDRIYRSFGTARMDFTTEFDNWLYIPDLGPRGLSTRFVVAQAFILPLNLLLAHLVTGWFDEPSVRIGRWISSRLVARTSSTSPDLKLVPNGL